MKKLKIGLYLLIAVMFSFAGLCDIEPPPGWNDPPADCGVGSGNYFFWDVQYPPNTFDCNTDARILVRVTPEIDPSYQGFNRAYLEVYDYYTSFVSNWVNLTPGVAQDFEIGGAIPYGAYYVTLWMINYQVNSPCPDSIHSYYPLDFSVITVTACNPPSKTMVIENDWQGADTIALQSYNVFQFQDTSALRFAFHAVDTKDSIIPGTFLVQESIPYPAEVSRYIRQHKEDPSRMYLCGVKEFVDVSGNPLLGLAGVTLADKVGGVRQPPSDSTGSLVAVKTLLVVNGEYTQEPELKGVNFKQLLEWAVIHELGHQRGVVGDTGHSSIFCAVNDFPINKMPVDSNYYNLYSNLHFCENHMNVLKVVQW